MDKKEIMAVRKQVMNDLKAWTNENSKSEDSIFYYHPNQDHIVLSHALFWIMSKTMANKFPHNKCFLLLRKYQEEMLEAYLTEDQNFEDLLDFCNILYDFLPYEMNAYAHVSRKEHLNRKLSAIAIVAASYGGDIAIDAAYNILDEMDFDKFGKVCCPAIKRLLPQLNKMVEEEMI